MKSLVKAVAAIKNIVCANGSFSFPHCVEPLRHGQAD
jgi:hypothetical protein